MGIRKIKPWLINTVLFSLIFSFGLGLGSMGVMLMLYNDHPSIVVEEKWRTITTAPPVTYLPETPFHIDDKVICNLTPPTAVTTTTIKVKPLPK